MRRRRPTEFGREGKIIGAVCHGPAVLVNATAASGESFVDGRRISGFTNNEGKLVHLDGVVPLLLEDALKERGATFEWNSDPIRPARL